MEVVVETAAVMEKVASSVEVACTAVAKAVEKEEAETGLQSFEHCRSVGSRSRTRYP